MRENASHVNYDAVTIFGKPALFSDYRIDRTTVPVGLYQYELRHEDEDWGTACQIAKGILVNFYGTILTAEPIELPKDDFYREIESGDLVYETYNIATISEYLSKYGLGETA